MEYAGRCAHRKQTVINGFFGEGKNIGERFFGILCLGFVVVFRSQEKGTGVLNGNRISVQDTYAAATVK